MSKKKKIYLGTLDWTSHKQIYLNIDNLKDGTYIIKITNNNKIVKEVKFKKNDL